MVKQTDLVLANRQRVKDFWAKNWQRGKAFTAKYFVKYSFTRQWVYKIIAMNQFSQGK